MVDIFVIGESNRTTSGEPNELLILPKMMKEGFLKEYRSDSFIRNYIGEKAFSRIEGSFYEMHNLNN